MPAPTSEIQRQIETVNDSSSDEFVDVFLSLHDPSDLLDDISLITEARQRRRVASSARDMIPSAWHQADSAAALVEPSTANTSLPTKYREERSRLQAQVESSVEPLLDNMLVKSNQAKWLNKISGEKGEPLARPKMFWSSKSIRLHLRRDDLATIVRDTPNVSLISLNRKIPKPRPTSPARLPDPLDENHLSTWGVEASGALAAWGATGQKGGGVRIGLLDTGIDAEHPDLKGRVANWAEFDGAGHIVLDSNPHDAEQHGTHCAGIMVGGNQSGKFIGLAPDATIAGALVLSGEHSTDAQILAGFEWCIEIGVDIISMSLGGLTLGSQPPKTYTRSALTAVNRGIFLTAAIGNNGNETSTSPGNDILIMSVGAIDRTGKVAAFSGGRTEIIEDSDIFPKAALPMVYSKPELSAPGVAILSSVPGGKWDVFSGTSSAAPHVSGAIALLLSATNIRDRVQGIQRIVLIEKLLTGSANEVGETGQNHRYGFGTLNILRAIGAAKTLGF